MRIEWLCGPAHENWGCGRESGATESRSRRGRSRVPSESRGRVPTTLISYAVTSTNESDGRDGEAGRWVGESRVGSLRRRASLLLPLRPPAVPSSSLASSSRRSGPRSSVGPIGSRVLFSRITGEVCGRGAGVGEGVAPLVVTSLVVLVVAQLYGGTHIFNSTSH